MPRNAAKKTRSRNNRRLRTGTSLSQSREPESAAQSEHSNFHQENEVNTETSCEGLFRRASDDKIDIENVPIDLPEHAGRVESENFSEKNVSSTNISFRPIDLDELIIDDEDDEYIVEHTPCTATIGDIRNTDDIPATDDQINEDVKDETIVNSVSETDDEYGYTADVLQKDNLSNSEVDSDTDCSNYYSDCNTQEEITDLCLEEGRGVCVVSCARGDGAGQRFRLEREALAALLARRGVAERRAVVVSVAGAFRGGKSFLLDFMLRYLYAQAGAREAPGGDWLGGAREPLRGFSWRNGSERDTAGLVLWSQPIPLTLPCGEEVVVLLMDTQGAFDEQSSLRDSSLVFALSTLLASVQVYNVARRLDECDLQHLQLFTEYAALGGGALQELQVLVRDWSAPYEHAFGADGGAAYLDHKLQIKEEHPEESREIRQRLKSSFERVDCFLLPHPGLTAATDPNFRGELADLREEFKQSLRQLVPRLLAPARLRVKTVQGQALRAGDLAVFLQTYLDEFQNNVPSPLTALAATAKARWAAAAAAARAALSGPPPRRALPRAAARERLHAARRRATEPLAPLAERAHETAALAQLEQELEAVVERQIEANARAVELAAARARGVWERAARARLADARLCLHPRDLPPLLRAAADAAVHAFNEEVESAEEDPELADLMEELEERMADVLPRLEELNCARNSAGVEGARAAAARALAPAPCLPAGALAAQHAAARAIAMAGFREARSAPTTHLDDPYITQLEQKINYLLRDHENQNKTNNANEVDACVTFYERCIVLNRGCWERRDLVAKHEEVVTRAIDLFHEKREGSTSRERDIYVEKLEMSLNNRFNELQQKNEYLNTVAVEAAFTVFRKTMDDSIGGLQVPPAELTAKLNAASAAGTRAFFNRSVATRSRPRRSQVDHYLNKLKMAMESEYAVYRKKNANKLSGGDLTALGVIAAGALALGAFAKR